MDERIRIDHDAHVRRSGGIRVLEEDEVTRLGNERLRQLRSEISATPIIGHVRPWDADAGLIEYIIDES